MSLYDARSAERDACGIGFVADAHGRASRAIVQAAIDALCRVKHRGAVAADAKTGDGAGILLPIPGAFFSEQMTEHPDPDWIGVANVMASHATDRFAVQTIIETAARAEAIDVIAWRDVPTNEKALGEHAIATMPRMSHAILLRPTGLSKTDAERAAHRARKRAEAAFRKQQLDVYLPSFSFNTITYKGLVAADELSELYPDLKDERVQAHFVIFHQRYSTNTAPTWERAQPFRMICHNGEINTIAGNVNRMRSREGRLGKWSLLEEEVLRPVIDDRGSDSAMLDNVVEMLVREGQYPDSSRDLRHAVAMLIPAAWESTPELTDEARDFYRWHASIMEPWDGPAGLVFTDGVRVGAALDRNGLRPLRYHVCEDGFIAACSEAGAINVEGHGRVKRGKLKPGQMIFVDPAEGGFQSDPVDRIASRQPYGAWLDEYRTVVAQSTPSVEVPEDLLQRQVAHGYTREEMTLVLRPAAANGKEPTFSMGDDTAAAALSDHKRTLYSYFKQRFAQVTNPAIDHLRERFVMSLRTLIGPHDPLLWERPEACAHLEYDSFILFKPPGGVFIDATFAIDEPDGALQLAVSRIADAAVKAAQHGSGIVILSDEKVSAGRAAVPSLLAVGAVNTALLRAGHRTRTSIVVQTDDARESHHFACLLGYGAEAIYPRLALATVSSLASSGRARDVGSPEQAMLQFKNAIEEGVLKVLSKMGISTVDSYRGAQIFDALGLSSTVIDACFEGTPSPVEGIGFAEIESDVRARHYDAFSKEAALLSPGFVKFSSKGEYHQTNPSVVRALHSTIDPSGEIIKSTQSGEGEEDEQLDEAHALNKAVKLSSQDHYEKFKLAVNRRPASTPRDLLAMIPAGPAIPVEEVEPIEAITKRFSTGAISHGAIGAEAHETLAVGMRLIGGKANTGEGGEDPARYRTVKNSAIKQVASGRFGVTPEYLAFAEELQIKIAQGSKPGEGGQLPGHKATEEIARLRHTQAGVALISPPPHHDIYSIEDLAQLIFDLKQANPKADVSVKLVSEAGVGTVAAGVIKGLADIVHISGADGGTGASPLSSIKNAGMPWEIGLAEAQQTLVANGLRARARVRVDGGFKTGRDVVIAALLGADEYSFGTAALLAEGCIMVRTCHLDTCPVGIATQKPELRAKFAGTPEMVATYMRFVAAEVREILASLGLRSVQEAIGRVELLQQRRLVSDRADLINLSRLLESEGDGPRAFVESVPLQRPVDELNRDLARDAYDAIASGKRIELSYKINNADRTLGATLGGMIGHEFGATPPPGSAKITLVGEAGQSFGAFITDGISLHLNGEANDYVGKGMGGGRIVISPPANDAGEPYLAGNTVLYGATGGSLFIAGRTGERFAVRNSGATAVVEGTGDHTCEYMTGGVVVVLGPTGHNVGAGMTGGEIFVYDPSASLPARVNVDLVEAHRPDDSDLNRVRSMITEHQSLTQSSIATNILDSWSTARAAFWRVAPREDVAARSRKAEGTKVAKG